MIRLGYACISMATKNNPNKKTTLGQLAKLSPPDQLKKLRKIMQTNFFNLLDLLKYNVEHGIFLYRLPSEFVPFATHSVAEQWDWAKEFTWDFNKVGEYIRAHGIRMTAHPGHYSILNTPSKKVLESTIKDFYYHASVFDLMGLDENSVLVTHVGGVYDDKESSLNRFEENFLQLPEKIKKRLVVENDDTSFTMREVLHLCERIKIPMVLDIHHHRCLHNGEDLAEYLPRIIKTWGARTVKMHFSTPKSDKEYRSHADDILYEDFMSYLPLLENYNVDIMLECKNKDEALLKLRNEMLANNQTQESIYL
ncbi:UV damage endonuclease UvdE [Brevibacillus laterosporus GI-9]|uniref:UV DNA damage repair endonuclease UvsE n=1 Tax=Brevibacillus laterosporus TaxID=1465 RepID=UPI00024050BB|nr:UV DNA damage repair endonuclease UvsE [Brevibacillus laterosporus]CCF15533.1 UV damage endonuclease UvdE [Brevibacillus laterosporus GI-9]